MDTWMDGWFGWVDRWLNGRVVGQWDKWMNGLERVAGWLAGIVNRVYGDWLSGQERAVDSWDSSWLAERIER